MKGGLVSLVGGQGEGESAHLEYFVLNLDTRHCRLVREKRDLIPQHLSVARLNEHRRKAGKVAEKRGDVRVGDVLLDHRLVQEALDGVEVVVFAVRIREIVVRLPEERSIGMVRKKEVEQGRTRFVSHEAHDMVRSTQGDMRRADAGRG